MARAAGVPNNLNQNSRSIHESSLTVNPLRRARGTSRNAAQDSREHPMNHIPALTMIHGLPGLDAGGAARLICPI